MEHRKSLEYTCPSHGGWGMVRIGMLIPQSHQLFVCPSACGRHGALGAIKQGFKDRLSYLYLDESDVISGYDHAIYEAVEELLTRLLKRPKVLLVFVSCLDDLIGTDCDAVIDELSVRYPDIQFRMGHMNPIKSDSDTPPLVSIWKNVYSLMEHDLPKRERGINMLGGYVPTDEKSEIFEVMEKLEMKLYHIGHCQSYEELKNMGNNCLNLLTASPVLKIAKELKSRQDMEYIKAYVSYDLEDIKEAYYAIFEKLKEIGMLNAYDNRIIEARGIIDRNEKKAKEAIRRAKERIGDRKLYIDYSAFANPLLAAIFFYKQGFLIERVYVKEIDTEDESYKWLKENTGIEIIKVNKHDIVNKWQAWDNSISIGLEAAYVSGSRHVVSVFWDEKMYGFYGVCMLMNKLIACIERDTDLEEVIHQAGLVV